MDRMFVFALQIYKIFHIKAIAIPLIIKRIAILFLRYAVVVQEGNIRKTMAARGLVNGRGPRSGRDLVFRCYPPELLFIPPKKQKLTFWVSLSFM